MNSAKVDLFFLLCLSNDQNNECGEGDMQYCFVNEELGEVPKANSKGVMTTVYWCLCALVTFVAFLNTGFGHFHFSFSRFDHHGESKTAAKMWHPE